MPPWARANRPFLFATAPVNAPRTCPKSSDSSSVSGIAAQFTRISGMARCALRSWMARATSSLPVPVSPVMSTVLLRLGDQLRPLDHRLHRPAAADDAVVIERFVELVDQVAVLRPEPLMLDCAAGHDEQLVDLEWLLQEVECAELHRLDGALDRRVRRHHHDLRPLALRRGADDLANQIQARDVGHQVVEDDEIEVLRRQQLPRRLPAGGLGHPVPVGAERASERLQDLVFVVDEQNRAGCSHRWTDERSNAK